MKRGDGIPDCRNLCTQSLKCSLPQYPILSHLVGPQRGTPLFLPQYGKGTTCSEESRTSTSSAGTASTSQDPHGWPSPPLSSLGAFCLRVQRVARRTPIVGSIHRHGDGRTAPVSTESRSHSAADWLPSTTSGGGSVFAFNNVDGRDVHGHDQWLSSRKRISLRATGTDDHRGTSGQTVVVDFSGARTSGTATIVGAVTDRPPPVSPGHLRTHRPERRHRLGFGVESKTATDRCRRQLRLLWACVAADYTVDDLRLRRCNVRLRSTASRVGFHRRQRVESGKVSFAGAMTAPLPGQAEFMVRIENVSRALPVLFERPASRYRSEPRAPDHFSLDHTYSFTLPLRSRVD